MTGARRETNRGCAASAWSSARSLGSRTPRRTSSSAPRQCCQGFSFARSAEAPAGDAKAAAPPPQRVPRPRGTHPRFAWITRGRSLVRRSAVQVLAPVPIEGMLPNPPIQVLSCLRIVERATYLLPFRQPFPLGEGKELVDRSSDVPCEG